MARSATRVLLVYPAFFGETFWNYSEVCKLLGARYTAAPLGLITVAAMLPDTWDVRLVNRNTEELSEDDVAWADMVMTGGMLLQQEDTLKIIRLAHKHGKHTVVGGPDATSSPHLYAESDFQVIGEAEGVIDAFIAAWEKGERSGTFTAEKFAIDVTKTPIPRFDLLKFDHYLYIGVQYSRGCPFTCEFCDIIELYGRNPRAKTHEQMLAELDRLYALGYRGHVDFVDDNLIGNKKAVKAFLPHLAKWEKDKDYPFEFSTEASINLSDDSELMGLMREANFFAVFVGIESPDPETLRLMRKKQNTRRNIAESIHKIYSYGMFVNAGFILGFDSESLSVADAMVDLIEDAAIPLCIVGLLYALPGTQLTRRLAKEGRLHANHDVFTPGDQCTHGINFDPARPMRDILLDYKSILGRVFDPVVYAKRLDRLISMLDRSDRPNKNKLAQGDMRASFSDLEKVHRIMSGLPERDVFWKVFTNCVKTNPSVVPSVLLLMAVFLHLRPYSQHIIRSIDERLTGIGVNDLVPSIVAAE
ncbi:MAG TPA: B12-binding domain-containing radical SAM protein [Xanthobacteraceae bacterium]|nr:B12-binding domain-containing radical SAM protein [Xanthobacteraceae bacterium]